MIEAQHKHRNSLGNLCKIFLLGLFFVTFILFDVTD